MFFFLSVLFLLSTCARADIFKIAPSEENNDPRNENIVSNAPSFDGYHDKTLKPFLSKRFARTDNISQLSDQIFLQGQNEADQVNKAKKSGLMTFQYSDPAAVDLAKFYATIAHLRFGIFYQQARDLEKEFGNILDVLHRQGLYDCLHEDKGAKGIPERILECQAIPGYFGALLKGEELVGGEFNILQKVFNKIIPNAGGKLDPVKEIVPQWIIKLDGYRLEGPKKRIGNVYAGYRNVFIHDMDEMVQEYKESREVDEADLIKYSVPSSPLTNQRIRELVMMDTDAKEVLISQWASAWAKVKTTEQYELAIEWLDRARLHPMVKTGYKAVIEEDKRFVLNELDSLKHQMDGYVQYAGFMRSFLDATETERLTTIAQVEKAKQITHMKGRNE